MTTLEPWILLTIAAAFLQNLRSATQKRLAGSLSTAATTASRFVFALPVALLWVGWQAGPSAGATLASTGPGFWLACAAGGVAQVVGTVLLLQAFRHRNFAVATAWSKTEAVQAALFSVVMLGEGLGLLPTLGILVSLVGVVLLSMVPGQRWTPAAMLRSPAAWLGMGSGAGFAISAVAYRSATLAVAEVAPELSPTQAAAHAVVVVLAWQTVLVLAWLVLRERGGVARLFRAWRWATLAGLFGALASFCWFSAMATQHAAMVRALGQVELVFAMLSAVLLFGERLHRREVLGVLLLVAGIVVLLLGG